MKKLLIANRGEIALRIMKTAHKMDLKTVAVYTDADSNMEYVRKADEAYNIGTGSAKQSFLNAEKIIKIA